jgi:hypothetical protein
VSNKRRCARRDTIRGAAEKSARRFPTRLRRPTMALPSQTAGTCQTPFHQSLMGINGQSHSLSLPLAQLRRETTTLKDHQLLRLTELTPRGNPPADHQEILEQQN